MKVLRKLMMALFAIATLGMTVACEKDNNSNSGNGEINASIVGSWSVDKVHYNGSSLSGEVLPGMVITMNENGTGAVVTEEHPQIPAGSYGFTWTLNGTTLTINVDTIHMVYTVTTLTNTDCVIEGNMVPVINLQGNVRLDLKRISTPTPDPDPEPDPDPDPDPEPDPDPDPDPNPDPDPEPQTADFPGGTNWTYTYNNTSNVEGFTVTVYLHSTLSYNTTGNGGVMTVEGNVQILEHPDWNTTIGPENINFTYTYDSISRTGVMTANLPGAGNESIAFEYNNTEDYMLVTNVIMDDEIIPINSEDIPEQLIFTRVNNK